VSFKPKQSIHIQVTSYSLPYEAMLVKQFALMHQIPCFRYREIGDLTNEQIQSALLIEGSVESVKGALQRLDIPAPEPQYYPAILTPFLGRQVWRDRFASALTKASKPLFIKSHDWKALTGEVFYPHRKDEPGITDGIHDLDVWCSDVVHFIAEWRIYVHQGAIVHAARYDDNEDEDLHLDWPLVQQAINLLQSTHPRADYSTYTKLLIDRWQEMVSFYEPKIAHASFGV